jgi:hexulose-6-phosphate isomerase
MRIGFMQGRLSPPVDGKLQAFPKDTWRDEFQIAFENGFEVMEWTLDRDGIYHNPIMTPDGRAEIRYLSEKHGLTIESLTGDFIMQRPFFKLNGEARITEFNVLQRVLEACEAIGIKQLVFPLMDQSRMVTLDDIHELEYGLSYIDLHGVTISFETDLSPARTLSLLHHFPNAGITYDTGNSAHYGHDPVSEINAYSTKIINVHIKDRTLGGDSVPLGEGDTDLPKVIRLLRKHGYPGNLILQPQRDKNQVKRMCQDRDMINKLWTRSYQYA